MKLTKLLALLALVATNTLHAEETTITLANGKTVQIADSKSKEEEKKETELDKIKLEELQKLKEFAERLRLQGGKEDSGTNIGGGNEQRYLTKWCKEQIMTLKNYKLRAVAELNKAGNYAAANQLFYDGLVQAMLKSEGGTLFLKKAIARGLDLAAKLDVGGIDKTERDREATYYVLANYYEFMLTTIAKRLDMQAMIPFLVDQNQRTGDLLEQRFVVYATKQLELLLETFVTHYSDRRVVSEVTTIGPEKYFLGASELLTAYVASDLEESLWAARFSCQIIDLESLNEKLQEFNIGNHTIFTSSRDAVNYTAHEIKKIVEQIKYNKDCE